MTKEHTPTPWVLDDDGDGDYKIISEEGHLIAVETSYYPIAPSIEDAAHIVKCVNMHDELVEALRPFATEVLDNYDDDSYPDVCTPQAKAYRYAISVLKKAGAL